MKYDQVYIYMFGTYMRCNKVGDQVESNPPPNSTKYVTGEVLHATEETNGVVDLW